MISFMREGDHKSAGDEFLFHIQCSHNIDKRGQQAASDRPEPPRSREREGVRGSKESRDETWPETIRAWFCSLKTGPACLLASASLGCLSV